MPRERESESSRQLTAGAARPPHPGLADFIVTYVGYESDHSVSAIHFGLPSTTSTVIIELGEPLDVEWMGVHASRRRYGTLVAGLHTGPSIVHTNGRLFGIQVELTPLGVRALFGLPIGALANAMVEHCEIDNSTGVAAGVSQDLRERLAMTRSWKERLDLLDAHFLAIVPAHVEWSQGHRPSGVAFEGWQLLQRCDGATSVHELADRLGWSRRHVNSHFRAEFGMGPKSVSRLFRFERAKRLLESGFDLSSVAAEAGYADQAHLSRDWKELAGRSPSATIAEMFPNLQDMEPVQTR